ncbi:MAG: hypothetical protein R3234_09905 [Thermoanaerobaculia bacterium]|nr:hypothetical protein [Thermoanaerobaculia bacterium]
MLSSVFVTRDAETSSIRRSLVFVAVLILGLAAVDRAVRTWWIGRTLPTADLYWIWDPEWPRDPVRPHAFQAIRSFEIDEVPDSADLLVATDEEYRLYLNGRWVGSGRLQPLGSWHAYPVASLLRPGENLLTMELRSGRGVGGLLLCLEGPGGEGCVVSSDGRWTSFFEYQEGLHQERANPDAGGPVRVWGRVGTGEWPLPEGRTRRPLAEECVETARRVPARRIQDLRPSGERARRMPVWRAWWPSYSRGIVGLRLLGGEREVGRLDFGPERKASVEGGAFGVLVTQPGQEVFVTTEGWGFRYLQAKGLRALEGAWYWPIREREECRAYYAPEERPDPRGILGVTPPRSHPPVENELWREFEGLSSLAGGE